MKQALVGMSGGVDSSVAAYLVREAGYETTGATMRLFDNEMIGISDKTCCSLSSIEDACAVANKLGISYVVYDMRPDFRCEVIDRFVEAYEQGATPNPCVACNKYLKFQRLYELGAHDLLRDAGSCCRSASAIIGAGQNDEATCAGAIGIGAMAGASAGATGTGNGTNAINSSGDPYVDTGAEAVDAREIGCFRPDTIIGAGQNDEAIGGGSGASSGAGAGAGVLLDAPPLSIATGHYAVIERSASGRFMLRKGLDTGKDQSYFLYDLTQEQLSRTLFPLGALTKAEVREIAEAQGLVTAKKRESQDICFVPGGDYASFICGYTGREYPQGDFVGTDGAVMGTHKGIIHYTIGQRKGLGLALKKPAYVLDIDAAGNRVILGDNEELFTRELVAKDFNWVSVAAPQGDIRASARIRYRHQEAPAQIIPLAEDAVKIIFDEPQRAITRGQSVVVYDGDYVLGGGIIE